MLTGFAGSSFDSANLRMYVPKQEDEQARGTTSIDHRMVAHLIAEYRIGMPFGSGVMSHQMDYDPALIIPDWLCGSICERWFLQRLEYSVFRLLL